MKASTVLSFAVLFFVPILFLPQKATSQVYTAPDSCLRYTYPVDDRKNFNNFDSVKTDTCKYSPTFNEMNTKYYDCQFLRNTYVFIEKPLLNNTFYILERY